MIDGSVELESWELPRLRNLKDNLNASKYGNKSAVSLETKAVEILTTHLKIQFIIFYN